MRVLHSLHRYLDESSNWIYFQLKYLRKTDKIIYAPIYINSSFKQLRGYHIQPLFHINPELKPTIKTKILSRLNAVIQKQRLQHELTGIDLIHIHFGGWAVQQLDWLIASGKPFVVSLYGYDYMQLPQTNPYIGRRYPELFSRASGILVEGPHGKKILEEYWSVSSEKIYIAPLGIEIQQTKCTLPSSKYNFKKWLQVASFKSKKGQEFTITAFSEILKSNPRDTLTLVGTGTEKCKCMELVQNLKIEKAVNFIDHIPHQELLPFIAAHDVFIHPSVQTPDGDTEGGAPVILIEAQSMGVPVISTFHADIPHIVSDGVTGFLAEEGSVADLVDKMNQLILLPESSLKKMKVQAIDWVKERFNAIRCAENIETIYETILQKG